MILKMMACALKNVIAIELKNEKNRRNIESDNNRYKK